MKPILLICFFLVSLEAFPCEDVRLDTDPNILGKVPAWDQGENGTCWAFAAVQLIDAYRFSHGDKDSGHLTSPFVAAVDGVKNEAGSYDWGNLGKAVEVVKKLGSCNARTVSDRLGTHHAAEVIQNLEAIHGITQRTRTKVESHMAMTKNIDNLNIQNQTNILGLEGGIDQYDVSPEQSRQSRVVAAQKCSLFLAQIGIEDKIAPGLRVLEEALELDRSAFAGEILSFICKDKKPMGHLPELKHLTYAAGSNEERNQNIKRELELKLNSKLPVAVNFCSSGVLDSNSEVKSSITSRCENGSDHFAVVVGSQKNSLGKCEYLIRDSACNSYDKKAKKKVCQNGQHWMDADRLTRNTKGLTSF